jgi:hypothetical protein
MQDYLLQLLAAAKVAAPIVGYWLLATALVNLIAHKSQVNSWCEKNPKLAAVLKIMRGMGCDPWLLIQGLCLAVIGRLPAKLRELIPVLLAALVLSGCVGTLEDSRGRISPALGAPRNAELSKRCQTLSDRSFYYGLASTGFGATGLGAVITSIPVDKPKWETVAVISGASAFAISTVTGGAALKSANTYTAEGCGK